MAYYEQRPRPPAEKSDFSLWLEEIREGIRQPKWLYWMVVIAGGLAVVMLLAMQFLPNLLGP
jgi:hypothetical protein